jgi:hypothetical protein
MWDDRLPLKRARMALPLRAFLPAPGFPNLFLSGRNLLIHISAGTRRRSVSVKL